MLVLAAADPLSLQGHRESVLEPRGGFLYPFPSVVIARMSVQDSENRPPTRSGVKFEIHLGDKKPNASAPKRVSEQPMKASVSQEELEKKQKDAEERRRVSFCRQKLSAILNLYPYTLTTVPLIFLAEGRAGKARQDPPNGTRDKALLPGHCSHY